MQAHLKARISSRIPFAKCLFTGKRSGEVRLSNAGKPHQGIVETSCIFYLLMRRMRVGRGLGIVRLPSESNNLSLYLRNLPNFMLLTTTPVGVVAYVRQKHVFFTIVLRDRAQRFV